MSARPPNENFKHQDKSPKSSDGAESPFVTRVRRLNTEILPTAPYLLRLPQKAESRAHSQSTSYSWNTGNLFEIHEQELQYISFRRVDEGSMLHAHGQWDDGNGGIALSEEAASRTSSGHTPSAGTGPRKKITLADYKNRDKKRLADGELKGLGFEREVEVKLLDVEAEAKEASSTAPKPTNPQIEAPIQRRSAETVIAEKGHEASNQSAASAQVVLNPLPDEPDKPSHSAAESSFEKPKDAVEPTSKKPGLPGHAPQKAGRSEAAEMPKAVYTTSEDANVKSAGIVSQILPPMLSPTLPVEPQAERKAPFFLPKMLSPTLPVGLEAELTKSRRRQVNLQEKNQGSNISPSLPGKRNSRTSVESSKRDSDITSSTLPNPSQRSLAKNQLPTSAPRQNVHIVSMPNGSVKNKSSDPGAEKKTCLVILRIKNKNRRKRLSDYLRLKATPGKNPWSGIQADQSDNEERIGVTGNKRRRSRGGSSAPERPTKRPGSFPQKPGTPAMPVSSPASSLAGSAQKTHLTAPTGEPKGSAMQRVGFQGGAPTPTGQSRDATPVPPGNTKETPEKRERKAEYRAEARHYITLATDLKHDCDKYLKNSGELPGAMKKLMIVIGTESVLCYMLASAIYDEPSRWDRSPGNSNLWKSIIGFLNVINRASSRPSQHLSGLLFQLEGIIRDTLQAYDDMNTGIALREYTKNEAPDLEKLTEANHAKILDNFHRLLKDERENQVKAAEAWAQGYSALYLDDLMTDFPKTFAKRRRRSGLEKGTEAVQLKSYRSKGYSIPMNQLTSAIEAVNFGLDLLEEFCEKEGLQWKPRLVFGE